MKITLNRANKIRNKIEALEIPVEYMVEVRDNRSEESIKEIVKEASDKFLQTIQTHLKQQGVVSKLRTLIDTANHDKGVTEIIAAVAEQERVIKTITNLARYAIQPRSVSVDDVIDIANHKTTLTNVKNEPQPVGKHNVNVAAAHTVSLENLLLDAKRRLEELKETRTALNHSVFIELDSDVVDFLEKYGIL